MKEVVELTKKMVEINSVSGQEEEILEYLAGFLKNKGAKEVWQNKDFCAALFTNGKTENATILTGHIDTVSAGDESNWKNSPWSCIENDEKLIGLGVTDMKAGLSAAFIAGIEAFNNGNIKDDLWLVAVANEEIDGRGSRNFVAWFKEKGFKYNKIEGIIPEPTNLDTIEIGHRGNCFVEITFLGKSGHASQQGNYHISALNSMNNLLASVKDIEDKGVLHDLLIKYRNDILGMPSFVPTSVIAGDSQSPNKTADICKMVIDIRTTPELDKQLDSFMNELAIEFNFSWKYHSTPVGSTLVSENSNLVKKLLKSSNLNIDNVGISAGATDQGEFVKGLNNTEVVVYGPGEFSEAHHQNEFIYKNKLEKFYNVIHDFLVNNEK